VIERMAITSGGSRTMLLIAIFIVIAKWYTIVLGGGFVQPYIDAPRHMVVVQNIMKSRELVNPGGPLSFDDVMYPPGMHILIANSMILTFSDIIMGVNVLMLATSLWALGIVYFITKRINSNRTNAIFSALIYAIFLQQPGLTGTLFGMWGTFALAVFFLYCYCQTGRRSAYFMSGLILTISFLFHHATYSYTVGLFLTFFFLSIFFIGGRFSYRMIDVLSLIVFPWVVCYGWWQGFSANTFLLFYFYPMSVPLEGLLSLGTLSLGIFSLLMINIVTKLILKPHAIKVRKPGFSIARMLAFVLLIHYLVGSQFSIEITRPTMTALRNLYFTSFLLLIMYPSNNPILLSPLFILSAALVIPEFQGSILVRSAAYWYLLAIVWVAKGSLKVKHNRGLLLAFLALSFLQTVTSDTVAYGINPSFDKIDDYSLIITTLGDATIASDYDYRDSFSDVVLDNEKSLDIVMGKSPFPPGGFIQIEQGINQTDWQERIGDKVFDSRHVEVYHPLT